MFANSSNCYASCSRDFNSYSNALVAPGWCTLRKKPTYRSVAYKTWNVGNARSAWSHSQPRLTTIPSEDDSGIMSDMETHVGVRRMGRSRSKTPTDKLAWSLNVVKSNDNSDNILKAPRPPQDCHNLLKKPFLNTSFSSCSDNESSDYFSAEDYQRFRQKHRTRPVPDLPKPKRVENGFRLQNGFVANGQPPQFVKRREDTLGSIRSSIRRKFSSGSLPSKKAHATKSVTPDISDFVSAEEAVAYIKKEMNQLRTMDLLILRRLYNIHSEMQQVRTSPCYEGSSTSPSLPFQTDCRIPPLPRCLQVSRNPPVLISNV